jgi:hypothetical protein
LLFIGCGGAPASRPGEPVSDAIALKPALAPLEYFVGSWLIEGKDPGSGQAFSLRYHLEPVLGGAWITGHGETPARDLEVRDYWGIDPISGEIVRIIVDSNGTNGSVRSRGWNGDTLILEGEARSPGGAFPVRETITRLGPSEFKAVWEAKLEAGWTTYSVERIRRQQGPRR